MKHPFRIKNHLPVVPCLGARRLVLISISFSLLVTLAITADLFLRLPQRNDSAPVWMRELTLSAPALWPAGSPLRHPETLHPGVDLRHTSGMEFAP